MNPFKTKKTSPKQPSRPGSHRDPSAEIHTLIIRAIREKRQLRFLYRGQPRIVEPYLYGVNQKRNVVLLGFEEKTGWKAFFIDEVEKLVGTKMTFSGTRPDYNQRDPLYVQVYAQI